MKGLHDEIKPGLPHTYGNATITEIINHTLQTKPSDESNL